MSSRDLLVLMPLSPPATRPGRDEGRAPAHNVSQCAVARQRSRSVGLCLALNYPPWRFVLYLFSTTAAPDATPLPP